MSILVTLNEEMKKALKAQDKPRLGVLRLLISALKYAQVDHPDMNSQDEVAVLRQEAKKRRESIAAYQAGGREELAEQEQYELTLIEQYLPKQMGEEEVRAVVKGLKPKLQSCGNYGEAMKVVMRELVGKAEGAMVAKIVREEWQG